MRSPVGAPSARPNKTMLDWIVITASIGAVVFLSVRTILDWRDWKRRQAEWQRRLAEEQARFYEAVRRESSGR